MYRTANGSSPGIGGVIYTSYCVNNSWSVPAGSQAGNPNYNGGAGGTGSGVGAVSGEIMFYDQSMSAMKSNRSNGEKGTPVSAAPSAVMAMGQSGKAPDYYIILFGANDAYYSPQVTAATYQANIQSRIDDYPNAGKIVLVQSWIPPNNGPNLDLTSIWGQYSTALDNVVAANISTKNIAAVKIPQSLYSFDATTGTVLNSDKLHLTTYGHQVFFNRIFPVLMS
jgi:hypothetical protein